MVTEKLSREDFDNALRKGKGRALAHVREYGDAGVEDILLTGCVHNQVYDRQCESSRGEWLGRIVSVAAEPARYHQAVIEAFRTSKDDADIDQMAELLVAFAKDGADGARLALLEKFNDDAFAAEVADHLIALDGLLGLKLVLDGLAKRKILDEDDYWIVTPMIGFAKDQLGESAVQAALAEATAAEPLVGELLKRAAASYSERADRPLQETVTANDFLQMLATGTAKPRIAALRFARHSSLEDLLAILELIEKGEGSSDLAGMLEVFRFVDSPRGAGPLLGFARSSDAAVRDSAIEALSRLADPLIEELARKLIADGEVSAVRLLGKNHFVGGYDAVLPLLPDNADADRVHHIGMDIISTCRDGAEVEAAGCLAWVYAHTPCSMCRGSAVRYLIEIDRLPAELARECRDDCVEDTRQMVAAIQ